MIKKGARHFLKLLKDKQYQQKQLRVKDSACFENVEWLSYHIPKAAGTSLRSALELNFGIKSVFSCYKNSFARFMSQGKPVYVDKGVKVIHGHFHFSKQHKVTYPNAKKIIWLRDPVERAWSTVNHWMRLKEHEQYEYIIMKYPYYNSLSSLELFELVIKDPKLNKVLNLYSIYLKNAKPQCFFFIGHVERYNYDLELLSVLMSVDLPRVKVNENPHQSVKPTREMYQEYFKPDYSVYDKFIDYNNKNANNKC